MIDRFCSVASMAVVTCLAATTICRSADAVETAQAQPDNSGWTFTAAPYLWAAGIEGTVGQFGLPPVEVDASFVDVLKNFDMGFMGAGEARNGRFGVAFDLQYIKVSTNAPTPRGVAADSIDVTSTTLSAFASAMYRAVDTEKGSLDLMAGGRVWSVKTDLDPIGGLLGRTNFSDGDTWVDPMIGAKARLNISDGFYLTGWGLVGGFDVGSDLTWDAMGAVGYEATDSVSLIAGYRALGVDYSSGPFLFDVVESGPIVGASIKF